MATARFFKLAKHFKVGPSRIDSNPHDLAMQLAGVYRVPISGQTGFTIAGGPAGEATLGPVAFMHRASSAENPIAPLGHHTFDSTHIAKGVVARGSRSRSPGSSRGHCFMAVSPTSTDGTSPMSARWIHGRRGYGFVRERSGSSKRHTAIFTSQRNWNRAVFDAPQYLLRG